MPPPADDPTPPTRRQSQSKPWLARARSANNHGVRVLRAPNMVRLKAHAKPRGRQAPRELTRAPRPSGPLHSEVPT
eukprot:2250873-Pyramimonas_sp.AAC.1